MRILLADTDPEFSTFVRTGLGQEGFVVDVARDGEIAFEMATEGEHDALLLDLLLPESNGHNILRKLRALGNDVPVLILSNRPDEQVQLRALNDGADDFLVKPVRLSALSARIRAVLRRSAKNNDHKQRGSILRVGKIELNLLTRECKCSGKSIHLTKVEFDLLEYFIRRTGEVISQNVLRQQLFADESDLDTNALPVHICNLRSKIDIQSSKSLIRTVRGCGYALCA